MQIIRTTGADPRIRPLLEAHAAFCAETSPQESCHFLPPDAMAADAGLLVWAAIEDGAVLGVGALRLEGAQAELKSMHTMAAARGRGVGRQILSAILAHAKAQGVTLLQLETGAMDAFAPARRIYENAGFTPCPPFGSYREDPHSSYFALTLSSHEPEANP